MALAKRRPRYQSTRDSGSEARPLDRAKSTSSTTARLNSTEFGTVTISLRVSASLAMATTTRANGRTENPTVKVRCSSKKMQGHTKVSSSLDDQLVKELKSGQMLENL